MEVRTARALTMPIIIRAMFFSELWHCIHCYLHTTPCDCIKQNDLWLYMNYDFFFAERTLTYLYLYWLY